MGTRQIVQVYEALGRRMGWQVEQISAEGVELGVGASYPVALGMLRSCTAPQRYGSAALAAGDGPV